MKINYVIGDATNPQGDGIKIIPHICNNKGFWAKGFVVALSKRWKAPERIYRKTLINNLVLGNVQLIQVEPDIYVVNMIAQNGIRSNSNTISPIRYNALTQALSKVNIIANELGATLHGPMFGAGLAGGKWNIIEKIINEVITVPIIIYVLNKKDLPQKVK